MKSFANLSKLKRDFTLTQNKLRRFTLETMKMEKFQQKSLHRWLYLKNEKFFPKLSNENLKVSRQRHVTKHLHQDLQATHRKQLSFPTPGSVATATQVLTQFHEKLIREMKLI